ncbi:group II intron maturase-specific domain-containing protein [Mycolicibacterium vanbaalenii]|uniref:group II intron maturase-specific domain-containing protein n=1 Tax=Mycolicibacterium vanbaalenii TaxID=110539 RepID=UPI001EFF4E39|nr:group II intron maturase-specific domain-containing protein [Mycolicibacterium vanbaalenii]WND59663.1 group II intron maturase-specific domain-containing protein [Mycolicibacterium vanbaalenii]
MLSPLLANIALSALDEHVHGPWQPGGTMNTPVGRARRRRAGLPNWRIVRYADDFVVLVFGNRDHTNNLREEIAQILAPLGLRFSEAKTRVVHMSEGFDFLGFRIQWKPKRGTDKWYVYVFIADRPVRSLRDKIRALTSRLSQQQPRDVLIRLNRIMRGWSNYFRYAVAKRVMQSLAIFVWHRIARWWRRLHRWSWTDLRRHLIGRNGRWQMPSADGVELFNLGRVPTERYRYRGAKIPNPWAMANHA